MEDETPEQVEEEVKEEVNEEVEEEVEEGAYVASRGSIKHSPQDVDVGNPANGYGKTVPLPQLLMSQM